MSINQFIDEFVNTENDIHEYNRDERRNIRRRLHGSVSKFIQSREKVLYKQIYALKRKNQKLNENKPIVYTVNNFEESYKTEPQSSDEESDDVLDVELVSPFSTYIKTLLIILFYIGFIQLWINPHKALEWFQNGKE